MVGAFTSLSAILTLDSTGFESGIQDAEDSMSSFEDKVSGAAQTAQRGGAALTAGVTAPLAALAGMSVRTASQFEASMAKSQSVMGDVSDTMREDLEQTARDVAKTTTFSASQAADAYYFLSSAGLSAAEAMETMPAAADFAAAGQMRLEEATSVLTTTMRAYGYEASEMTGVTDTLAKSVSSHNTTMNQLSTAMSQVGPVAASLGISLEETAAAIGSISDRGVQGEKAGTALRNVMSQLSDETSTVSEDLNDMGVATRTSSGEIVSLTQLLANMESAGIEAGDAAKLFGTEAGPAMAALMKQGSAALEENTSNIREAEGAAADMAATQRDTLNAEMQIAKSNIQDVGIAIGGDLMPMVSTLTGHVTRLSERFQGLDAGQRKTIIAAAGVAAALGPVLLVAGTLAQSIVALSGAYGVLSGAASTVAGVNMGALVPSLLATQVALGPVTLPLYAIVGGLLALASTGAAVAYAWKNNVGGIRDSTIDAFETVTGWLDRVPNGLLALLGPVGVLYEVWRNDLFGVQGVVDDVFSFIGEKISWLISRVESIPGIGGGIEAEAEVGGPETPEEPTGESTSYQPQLQREADALPTGTQVPRAAETQSDPAAMASASTARSEASSPEQLATVAADGRSTPPSREQSTGRDDSIKKLIQEVRELTSALSGPQKVRGDLEIKGLSRFNDRIDSRAKAVLDREVTKASIQ